MREQRAEDREAFAAWVHARRHGLLRSTFLLTGDLHHAEDLLQDALLKVALHWPQVRDGNPDAYIRTILFRDHVSWLRRRRAVPVAQLPETSAVSDTDATERQLMLESALGALTKKQRAVIVLRFFDDLTERQTAAVLGVTIGTVKSQTSTALERLRTRVSDLDPLRGRESDRP